MYAVVLKSIGDSKDVLDLNFVRHIFINTLRSNVLKFKSEYGKPVLCADMGSSWRKQINPYYKANRKKSGDKEFWESFYHCIRSLIQEMQQHGPYKVVFHDTAEGDDVIAVLTQRFKKEEKILILAGDGDYKQLHGPNVKQYSPMRKEYVECLDSITELTNLILDGDKDDGVPNVLSPIDTFVNGIRQKSMFADIREELSKKMLQYDMQDNVFEKDDPIFKRIKENNVMVNLEQIPNDIRDSINQAYDNASSNKLDVFLKYMMAMNLKLLIPHLQDFSV